MIASDQPSADKDRLSLEEGYRMMAADTDREAEAVERVNACLCAADADVCDTGTDQFIPTA